MLNRSVLSVPSLLRKHAVKAAQSAADVVMLDLEDSVPSAKKVEARQQLTDTLGEVDFTRKLLTVRVNEVGSSHILADVQALVSSPSYGAVTSIVVPKVHSAADVHFICKLITAAERAACVSHPSYLRIEPSIESPLGLENVRKISTASPRVRSLVFGIADYTAALGAPLDGATGHGDTNAAFPPSLRWIHVMSTIANAAAAANVLAIDAPHGTWSDSGAVMEAARAAHAVGFSGKWAIHPAQITAINEGFSPTDRQIAAATSILEAQPGGGELVARLLRGEGVDGGDGGSGVGGGPTCGMVGGFGGGESAATRVHGVDHGGASRASSGDGMMDAATVRVAVTTLMKAGAVRRGEGAKEAV